MLTLKQRIFINKYIETMSATQAAYEAYNVKNRNVAGVIGHQNLRKLKINRVISDVFELTGLSDEGIARRLKSMIETGGLKALKLVLGLRGYYY